MRIDVPALLQHPATVAVRNGVEMCARSPHAPGQARGGAQHPPGRHVRYSYRSSTSAGPFGGMRSLLTPLFRN
jgi:hypothetical protein